MDIENECSERGFGIDDEVSCPHCDSDEIEPIKSVKPPKGHKNIDGELVYYEWKCYDQDCGKNFKAWWLIA